MERTKKLIQQIQANIDLQILLCYIIIRSDDDLLNLIYSKALESRVEFKPDVKLNYILENILSKSTLVHRFMLRRIFCFILELSKNIDEMTKCICQVKSVPNFTRKVYHSFGKKNHSPFNHLSVSFSLKELPFMLTMKAL